MYYCDNQQGKVLREKLVGRLSNGVFFTYLPVGQVVGRLVGPTVGSNRRFEVSTVSQSG
jgi:hypothetical protein